MKYVVYMNDLENVKDSANFDSASDRDYFLNTAKLFDYITDIAYAPIYASGEYGKRVLVKGNLLNTI